VLHCPCHLVWLVLLEPSLPRVLLIVIIVRPVDILVKLAVPFALIVPVGPIRPMVAFLVHVLFALLAMPLNFLLLPLNVYPVLPLIFVPLVPQYPLLSHVLVGPIIVQEGRPNLLVLLLVNMLVDVLTPFIMDVNQPLIVLLEIIVKWGSLPLVILGPSVMILN
jgi:hypothetical protein